ncbi:unnamed protein product, partial [Ixodes persulcatus]
LIFNVSVNKTYFIHDCLVIKCFSQFCSLFEQGLLLSTKNIPHQIHSSLDRPRVTDYNKGPRIPFLHTVLEAPRIHNQLCIDANRLYVQHSLSHSFIESFFPKLTTKILRLKRKHVYILENSRRMEALTNWLQFGPPDCNTALKPGRMLSQVSVV